ncbi:MAG: hypothetical protein Q4F56_01265 [Candidatus Saccharibacteria bacterium]|nr:hypothetical protein [Candidatus Saccharibacteria bacterium]
MKRKQKKVLGLFGLVMVVAMTFFAAALPGPETSAVATLTDTINVKVVGEDFYIKIIEPEDKASNARTVIVSLERTGEAGDTPETELATIDADFVPGTGQIPLNLDDYGYGEYTIKVRGEDREGNFWDKMITFSYYPVTVTAEQDNNIEGQVNVDLDYDQNNSDIDKLVINVYDENGNLIEGLSPVEVTPPTTSVPLDFGKYGLESGKYIIAVTAYDTNGNPLYAPYEVLVNYTAGEKSAPDIVPVPDTGGIFQNANISTTDYLITGIIMFSLVAIAGIMFAMKDNKKTKAKTNRRR